MSALCHSDFTCTVFDMSVLCHCTVLNMSVLCHSDFICIVLDMLVLCYSDSVCIVPDVFQSLVTRSVQFLSCHSYAKVTENSS